ncbi:ABC transporter ATP-binding protein [Roseibacillus persicicus]|uniref:ABC transporter ATP-binding protein n=1 Tax=Roseibacillus persicicus TaxID=454148 RepID=A0A918TWY8_9BACT|nr:oligopeptide/dipeptide ABC transporter ATP-binding protein [Roseibacillus persicicus]MDQ8189879.1 ATP-binding cassette domain-containing protein [Roseibacillus persicicus]GHC62571.1 ABC transporter ATP-binding protein [Roseibacillus persicicus]
MSNQISKKNRPLLEVNNLKQYFPVKGGVFGRKVGDVKAVDGVSLKIGKGETLGLVGESGCGKSTLGKSIVRLLKPTAGSIHFQGNDITHMAQPALRPLRQDFQMVFQDPAESLDSRMNVNELVAEPLIIQHMGNARQRRERVAELLDKVGLPKSAAQKFPFEFSGGQRQRIGIARALAVNPDLLILDEPVSALDVSVQAQVINLLLELQRELGLSYLFIAHDLAVVKHVSDRVAVMYLGKLVEEAPADELYEDPKHAYTKALFTAIPVPDPGNQRKRTILEGEVPSPINPPAGSAFGSRINHPDYEKTIGVDLTPVEVSPGHLVAPDVCCLEPEVYAGLTKEEPSE